MRIPESHCEHQCHDAPNAGVRHTEIFDNTLCTVLRNGIGPGSFAFAEFHEPGWHSPKDGVEAIEKSIDHLQRILYEPECRAMDCESLLEVLPAVKERLLPQLSKYRQFVNIRQVAWRVKRYRDGDNLWCVTGLLRADQGFRRTRGYNDMPKLIDAHRNDVLDKQTQPR